MFDSPRLNKNLSIDNLVVMLNGSEEKLPTNIDIDIVNTNSMLIEKDQFTLRSWYESLLMVPVDDRIDNIVFLDTETSHLNGFAVSIALIGYSISQKAITFKYYKEINPGVIMDPEAIAVHGITNEMTQDFNEAFMDIEKEVTEIINTHLIVAHNAIYDIGVLAREYERLGEIPPKMYFLDTMKRLKDEVKAKNSAGRLKDPRLSEAASHFGIVYDESALHNALEDTELLSQVFIKALEAYEKD